MAVYQNAPGIGIVNVYDANANRGLQRYIADSNSGLLGLQPEGTEDMATSG